MAIKLTLLNIISAMMLSSTVFLSVAEAEPATIYEWVDAQGVKHISNSPPPEGAKNVKQKLVREHDVMTVSMDTVKPIKPLKRNKKVKVRRQTSVSLTTAQLKAALKKKNHTHCRWTVGTMFDLYIKIGQHQGSSKSMWCEDFRQRAKELRELASEGESCYYPLKYYPKSC